MDYEEREERWLQSPYMLSLRFYELLSYIYDVHVQCTQRPSLSPGVAEHHLISRSICQRAIPSTEADPLFFYVDNPSPMFLK